MDDPFVQLRKDRTQEGLDLLKTTKVRQIITENPKLITAKDSESVSICKHIL